MNITEVKKFLFYYTQKKKYLIDFVALWHCCILQWNVTFKSEERVKYFAFASKCQMLQTDVRFKGFRGFADF